MEEILALDMRVLTAHTRAAGDEFTENSHRAALAAVHPDHRTGPVLKKLLADMDAFVRFERVTELQSHVYKTNLRSLALHRRLGFKVIGENKKGFAFSLLRSREAGPVVDALIGNSKVLSVT